MTAPKRSRIAQKTHRLIASRHPPAGVFDDLAAGAQELRAAIELESLTNDRLQSRMNLLPDEEIATGPGASLSMAAFLHADPACGRFTGGRLGAWYAALELDTAIAETVYHNTRRLELSQAGFPNRIQMRQLTARCDASLVDVRGLARERPELYRDTDYSASQSFGDGLRWPISGEAENGIVFDSLRRSGGINVCLFRPSLVRLPVLQGDHFEYHWTMDGTPSVMKLTNVKI